MSPTLQALHQVSYTVNDLHRRLSLLQECLETVLYDEPQQMRVTPAVDRRETVIKQIAEPSDTSVLLALDEQIWSQFTPATLSSKMNELMAESETLPVMTLYLPVVFTEEALKPLSDWVRTEVEPSLLFDVHVNPAVAGGCAFVYKDIHFDWSLKRHLLTKRGMITTLLNSYAH